MATGSQFGVSCYQLVELMAERDKEGEANLAEYGGVEGLAEHLKTNLKLGVSDDPLELEARRREYGANCIPPVPPKSFLLLAFEALQVREGAWERREEGGRASCRVRSTHLSISPIVC